MNLTVAGQPIDDPMPIWREYASRHPRTILEYDMGDPGDPNQVTWDEIRRTRIIGSRISNRQSEALIERAREPSCPWLAVPQNASLADADPALPDGLFDQAAKLYWHFTVSPIPGVRTAKAHKTLHIKRSALYPILDARLKAVYSGLARSWVGELSRLSVTIKDSPPYWAAIRQDLIANEPVLDICRRRLADESDEVVRQMTNLNTLRLLDILVWK